MGVALIVNNDFCPHELTVETTCELAAVQICLLFDMIIVSVYRPPSSHVCKFADELLQIITQLNGFILMHVLGDFNEDIGWEKKHIVIQRLSPWVLGKWLKNLHVIVELLLIMCM